MRIKSIFFALCATAMLLFSGCYKTGFGELSGGDDGGDDDPRPRLYLADFDNLTAENEAKLASSTEWVILDSGAWDEQNEKFDISADDFKGLKTTLKAQSETIDLDFENIQSIPDEVFGDSSLNMIGKVELPKAIYVGRYSFWRTSITSISMPSYTGGGDNGEAAFNECSSLTEISADKMEQVASYMFISCTSLEEVYLPKVSWLGHSNFAGCTSLKSIILPSYTQYGRINGSNYQIYGPSLEYVELATAPGVTIAEIGLYFFQDIVNGNDDNCSDMSKATLKIGSLSSFAVDLTAKQLYFCLNSSTTEGTSGSYTFGSIEVVDNN